MKRLNGGATYGMMAVLHLAENADGLKILLSQIFSAPFSESAFVLLSFQGGLFFCQMIPSRRHQFAGLLSSFSHHMWPHVHGDERSLERS